MVAEWAGVLAKAAAPAAGQLVAKPLKNLFLPWVVAYSIRNQARKSNVGRLPYWKLRRYLSTGEPLEALKSAEPQRYEAVSRGLAALDTSSESRNVEANLEQLAVILLRCYTAALDPNTNVEMYSAITAERVGSRMEERDSKRFTGDAMFEKNLDRIPPHRADEARDLRENWPAVTQFVQEFVNSPDRAGALTSWQNMPPTWFQARPSAALTWFARLANDYGLRDVASAAFEDAINEGATPEAYWRTRRVLLQSNDIEVLAESVAQYASDDPVAAAIATAHSESYAAAADVLHAWDPQPIADKALKSSLLSQFVATDDLMGAIALSQEGFTKYRSASCGTLSAQFLLERGQPRRTAFEFADIERALECALKARDAIRLWGGPSSRPVELAIISCRLLGRTQQAWSLARPAPDGIATESEAAAESVRKESATIAAQVKTPELARELATDAGPMTQHEVEALIALFQGDGASALTQFQLATDYAVLPQDIERLAFHMAQLGGRSPRISQLAAPRQEELGLIADARNGSGEALAILRTRSRSNRMLSRVLIGFSIESGNSRDAALQAEQSGKHWADPEFALFAAEQYMELEDYDSAVRCAETALDIASPTWENALRAYNVVIQAQTVRGRWAPAGKAAMQVLAQQPDNVSAVWVVVLCEYNLGHLEQSWNTYSDVGSRPAARNEHEATVRIDLWRRFEAHVSNLAVLEDLLERFPNSEAVKSEAAKALTLMKLDENDVDAVEHVRRIVAPLYSDLAEVFVKVKVDEDNPLATFDELLAEHPDLSDQDALVETGRAPLGLAATLRRRSFTEILAIRTHAPVFSGDPEHFDTEVQNASSAMGSRVAVDLSTLYFLSLLDEPVADQLLGCFLQPEASQAQLIDSIQGSDSLAGLSTLQIGRAPDGSAYPITISSEEAEARYRRAQRIRAQFEKVTQNDRVGVQHFPEAVPEGADAHFAWLAAADNAVEAGVSLWCDDRVTRLLAAAKGVPTFGTNALLEALRRDGTMTEHAYVAYQALLVSHYAVGLRFVDDWLTHAATLDGWKPRGVASFVAHSPGIGDATPLVNFVTQALHRNIDDPEAIRNWTAALSYWLVHQAPKGAAHNNLVILLSSLLREHWLQSSMLPFVLRGIRDGSADTEVDDPLRPAMEAHYRLLAEQQGWVPAAQRLRELVAVADRDDRVVVTGVVLRVT